MACMWLCAACLVFTVAPTAADSTGKMIEGTIRVHPDSVHHIAPGDRLIIKLFYPSDGFEKDQKFAIVSTFTLPVAFQIAPTMDMSRRSKWPAYMVEAFTDKDQDILSIVPGELHARTPDLVPLGTTDIILELNASRK